MPLYPKEKGQLLALLAKADNAELVSLAQLYYESLQRGRFTVEELTLLGRQFYGKTPWAGLNRNVKLPLLRSAQAMLGALSEIFEVVPEPPIAAPPEPAPAPELAPDPKPAAAPVGDPTPAESAPQAPRQTELATPPEPVSDAPRAPVEPPEGFGVDTVVPA